ncbi:hypothetical protein COOONC_10359 [Cooperia oncophora]
MLKWRAIVDRYLSFWHLDLDPVSLCAVLISIGMAVDFVAHTTYHYQNYIPLVFVKTITLVVIWGLWHGLVLLPAFLSQIPLRLLNFNCYRVLVNARNEVAGQEMLLLDGDAIRT